jgi:hypothetical protein
MLANKHKVKMSILGVVAIIVLFLTLNLFGLGMGQQAGVVKAANLDDSDSQLENRSRGKR